MFERVAVVNRGEPAVRFIRAAREWNREHRAKLRTIALHTPAERHALFAKAADEAVVIAPRPGGSANPYLDLDVLTAALRQGRADAAWVGWGFVAERAEFADRCAELGVTFIGPSGEVMRRLGDKIGSKLLAENAGVPVAPWSGGAVGTTEEALHHGRRIGYPLMVKATAGGGGRGIRIVTGEHELAGAFESARGEALRSFGDATVFLERVVDDARHVEVQIVADAHDHVWALGVRDCSVQRRRQKVLEESASTALSPEADAALRTAAIRLARAAGYRNAGTVEFLYQPALGSAAFLEVNTRLQVEHPVTEETTGVDIVKLQLHVAAGGRLDGDVPAARGHAIEVRLNAEDPDRGFAPAPGRIELLDLPTGPGVRVDSGVSAGDTIPSEYDSMIAKVIAWGRDRSEALARLGRALEETSVVVEGGTTNKSFLLALLDRPEVQAGDVTTSWLDRVVDAERDRVHPLADVALAVAAAEVADGHDALERAGFFASAARGRPQVSHEMGHRVELRMGGSAYDLSVSRQGPDAYCIDDGKDRILVVMERLGQHERRVRAGDRTHRVLTALQGVDVLVEVDGVSHRISRDEGGVIRAPAPGLVVAVPVSLDDVVEANATVVVLEAMKMETAITTPVAGKVREVLVTPNVQIGAGLPLVRVEPLGGDGAISVAESVGLGALRAENDGDSSSHEAALAALTSLRHVLLGYDFDRTDTTALLEHYGKARADLAPGDQEVLAAEMALLELFADVCALTRNRRVSDEVEEATTRSEREHLLTYLRSLDVDREGLPPSFAAKLRRALGHYGVADLDRSASLHDALFRLYLAHQRAGDHVPVVRAILDRLDTLEPAVPEHRRDHERSVLDRLVVATQLRFPDLGARARAVRYRTFDEPLLERQRVLAYERVRDIVAELDKGVAPQRRADLMAQLVTHPYPLLGEVLDRIGPQRDTPDPLVEAIVRRYYVIRDLRNVEARAVRGHQLVRASYGIADLPLRLVALATSWSRIDDGLAALADLAAGPPEERDLVLEIYLAVDEPVEDLSSLPEALLDALARHGVGGVLRMTVALQAGEDDAVVLRAYTFRDGSLHEDALVRGLHPMIAQRLQLWRLTNFDVERLPSSEEVLLLDCVARDNPGDERLIALAEVRDVTMVRDSNGRVVGLPELEHVLSVCVDELRAAQTRRPPERRLEWNRIVLYAWPTLEAPLDQLATVVRNLAPITEGVGLEQVTVQARIPQASGEVREVVVRVSNQPGTGVTLRLTDPPTAPMVPNDEYTRRVLQSRRRGAVYPFEIVPMLTQLPGHEAGSFVELDLDESGALAPVARPPGQNTAAIVAGLVRTPTTAHPEGMARVVLLGDPLKALGSLAEPECRRVIAALDLAQRERLPVEWFAVSSGAKISMDSGTENMDWVARALRRIVEFTQAGGEINLVVAAINVGAQPYWNAEATMLMHTKGILVMTPEGAMVLTGKQALDYSGGVSAEDNFGIGGYDRIMGPNGQAQYWAPDMAGAVRILFAHYDHSYVAPGERFPRRVPTSDALHRDVRSYPHPPEAGLATVGDVFSEEANAGRKKPFDIRTVIRAVSDQDHALLERWADMRDADTGVVIDAHLGGYPVTLIGIESKPLPRWGLLNADGPDQWSAGTLFPLSSKKVARGINAASGSRPVVVLANLSGFDGSPESLRRVQLEYGAEIGRAVVNFDGPFVFCLISRYHGGAFVVFSATLNDNMEVLAVEGSYASVIGGAPAAAVVFAGDVRARTMADIRVREMQARVEAASSADRGRLQGELSELIETVRSETLGRVAAEFDAVHSIERAREVGSVHDIIPAASLRPSLIAAIERGMARTHNPVRNR